MINRFTDKDYMTELVGLIIHAKGCGVCSAKIETAFKDVKKCMDETKG